MLLVLFSSDLLATLGRVWRSLETISSPVIPFKVITCSFIDSGAERHRECGSR